MKTPINPLDMPLGKLTCTKLPLSDAQKCHNCNKLADIIERLTPKQFNMHTWGDIGRGSYYPPCGTVACAMGWATLSGAFEGLQYTLDCRANNDNDDTCWAGTDPIVNGKVVSWGDAAISFFGRDIFEEVFTGPGVDKTQAEIVAGLRHYARHGDLPADWYD